MNTNTSCTDTYTYVFLSNNKIMYVSMSLSNAEKGYLPEIDRIRVIDLLKRMTLL